METTKIMRHSQVRSATHHDEVFIETADPCGQISFILVDAMGVGYSYRVPPRSDSTRIAKDSPTLIIMVNFLDERVQFSAIIVYNSNILVAENNVAALGVVKKTIDSRKPVERVARSIIDEQILAIVGYKAALRESPAHFIVPSKIRDHRAYRIDEMGRDRVQDVPGAD